MIKLDHCLNCKNADLINALYSAGDDITMAVYYCPQCEHQYGLFVEDKSVVSTK